MQVSKKDLEKSQIELTVELSLSEFKPYISRGVGKVSRDLKIEGFRPGKVPYEIIKQKVGEMAILEEAGRLAINGTLDEIIDKNTAKEQPAIGQPQVNITKLAPGNPFTYKVILSLLPTITPGKYKGLDIKLEEIEVDDQEVDKALDDLREMRASEKVVEREIKKGDKVAVNIKMFLGKVPLEESGVKDLSILVGRDYFVPGFDQHILGAKKEEEKKFQLEYPQNHHQKNLAGKKVDFEVKIKEVVERKLPDLNDKLAETFQLKNLAELKKGIRKNITIEKKKQSDSRNEMAMLEKIVTTAKFGDIPEAIITSEVKNMITELEQSVVNQGGKFADYLSHLSKSKDELMLEMAPSAIKRVKTALIIRTIADKEKIVSNDQEIEAKLKELKELYKDKADIMKMLSEHSYRSYLSNILVNEKVLIKLKEWNYASTGTKQKG